MDIQSEAYYVPGGRMNWTLRRRAGASWVGVVVVCGVDNDTVDKDGVVVGFLRMDSMEGPEKKNRK